MKSLVIVESPAKAKTLNKFLGSGFSIKASIGHVKDLPRKELGVDVEKDFKPKYVVIEGKAKVLKELKKAAKESDRVFLAPDPDREGEAIAWHIAEELNGDSDKVFRVTFNEITERAVTEAIKHPRKIDVNLVNAQQARRILDRLVGYNLSPLLWRKVSRGLSAGRVQSIALRFVVDREREINAFKPEEYWSITATLVGIDSYREGKEPLSFNARLFQFNGQKADIKSEAETKNIVKALGGRVFSVKKVEKKSKKRTPPPPFITSTLQQEASRKLRFPVKKTMLIAQHLYEGVELGEEGSVGLITYMRTDSVCIAAEAQQEARGYISNRFGKDYLPEKPPRYKSRKEAQEAHEAIRPASVFKTPEDIKKHVSKDHYFLYNLIWNRFLASQMAPAQLEQTAITIDANPPSPPFEKGGQGGIFEFRATGTVVKFPGFMAVYIEGIDEAVEEEGLLPPLKEEDVLKVLGILSKQHFTQPPPRYTEATIVKDLETKGIGRPSTYATIISTIQERKYVEKTEGKFKPTELGIVVNDLLVERFPELMDISFTAKMETNLDNIEEGHSKWVKVIREFYTPFEKALDDAMKNLGKVKPKDIGTEIVCEKCGKPMVIRWGRHGRFMACSGYPECKNTKPLEGQGAGDKGQGLNAEAQQTNEVCEKCSSPMVLKSGRFGKFLACSKYPECKTTKPLATGIKCPEDGGDIIERRTKKGKVFFSCSNYPKCKFATWYRPVSKNCPKCGANILAEKRTKAGEFSVCLKKGCGYKEEIQVSSGQEQTAAK
ncbi:MAG: type I DNA topoisomerase [Nitrospirae bacterium]|nr:type I DNA topoisomerase [Nitrospirota bacterium]